MKRLFFLVFGLLGFGFWLSACSLAGDVTPPPDAQSFTSANTTVTAPTAEALVETPMAADSGLGYPSLKPATALGAIVYADHCAACHGDTGKGDGRMSPQLPTPPPDFSNPETLAGFSPLDLFTTVTTGRQDKFMPPFNNLLTEGERWNVVSFLFTLSAPQSQIETGQAVYAANCLNCHGETGAGDGPAAVGTLPDFGDQQFMAGTSQAALLDFVTQGKPPAMPAYADALSALEIQAVAAYVRTLAYDYTAPAAIVDATGTVSGKVVNATPGATVPAGLTVNLHSFDDFNSVSTITATVALDGSYRFDAVPYTASRQFLVTTSYAEVVYASEAVTFPAGQAALDLPVTVYEVTDDPARVRIQQMHVFFEFNPASVTVGEVVIFANDGDRTLWRAGGTLDFPLPGAATDVQVPQRDEGADWVRTADGLSIIAPLVPGQQSGQVIFTYDLPYTDRLDFAQLLLYPADSANVLLPDVGVKLSSGLKDDGQQSIQGTSYRMYSAANLAANSTFAFTLSGKPGAAEAAAGPDNTVSLAVGTGALAVALAGIGYWLYERRRPERSAEKLPVGREALLQAIAQLDDDFEADAVGERAYERRRARLKAQLLKVMQDE